MRFPFIRLEPENYLHNLNYVSPKWKGNKRLRKQIFVVTKMKPFYTTRDNLTGKCKVTAKYAKMQCLFFRNFREL